MTFGAPSRPSAAGPQSSNVKCESSVPEHSGWKSVYLAITLPQSECLTSLMQSRPRLPKQQQDGLPDAPANIVGSVIE